MSIDSLDLRLNMMPKRGWRHPYQLSFTFYWFGNQLPIQSIEQTDSLAYERIVLKPVG